LKDAVAVYPEILNEGYIKLGRGVQRTSLWFKDHIYFKAWTWMQIRANHKTIERNGFIYKRGEFLATHAEIIEALRMYTNKGKKIYPSKKQVRVLLSWFEREGEIKVTPVRGNNFPAMFRRSSDEHRGPRADSGAYVGIKIQLVNYDTYQDQQGYKGIPKGNSKGRPRAHQGHNNNNDKRMNKNETHIKSARAFLDWYSNEFNERFHHGYVKGEKDLGTINVMLQTHTIEQLKTATGIFFKKDDSFLRETGHSISAFRARINGVFSDKVRRPIGLGDFSNWR
jgi:hypothetical protein